ncbi:MAG: succinate dehydrogenase/fumarate reductase iron-sulfur subunit [bacterium]|nr:succinate dehydrogenase/fumarate reductase iron-sulfur subunit [bacterium]
MKFTVKMWRQKNAQSEGHFESVEVKDISPDMSFLDMLDVVNEERIKKGEEPFAFDNDCREGICGTCSLVVNGQPHGANYGCTTCQLHMRMFTDGETITVEPFRSKAFPIVKDCVIDRSAFDRIIQAGGYVNVNTGSAPEAATTPVPKPDADRAFAAAACIGCGACVAACPNASAMLFTSAKIAHLGSLPQGKVEADQRVLALVKQMDKEGFGACTNAGECAAVCPKEVGLDNIARMNRQYLRATIFAE